ncbi:MAG: S46 family peptidase, partial [Gemmatimonadetes bacterium]|nr:S46 family peptidase [Gemmatimonadota bacterium]
RFQVYGTDVPPDGSSSPRITDGVVKGYEYNGTLAPPYTTFFGLYDHYYSYGSESDWHLVERFLPPPPGLDMNTPLNFVSTADTYGGNSGSPAVTPDFKIVGLNFDRNIEGLSRDFIYLPEQGRNIMVDVRAIIEAMDDVYDGDRVVAELITGRLFRSEADADALGTLR